MSDETIARLRALDPERVRPAPTPPIERLLARIDAEPDTPRVEDRRSAAAQRQRTGGPRGRRRSARHRRPIAAAVALACLAAVAVAALVLGGNGADPRRDDALVPAGDGEVIVHTISRTAVTFGSRAGRDGMIMQDQKGRLIGRDGGPVERWSTTAPERWRSITTFLPAKGAPGGTSEQAYADRLLKVRDSWRPKVRRFELRTVPDIPSAGDGALLMDGVSDPRATVERMLATGEVRRAGTVVRDGRELLRLTATTRARRVRAGGRIPPSRTTYLIDAERYVPVEVERSHMVGGMRGTPQYPATFSRTVFDVYENLPLTSETAAFLRLGGPTG